MSSSHKVNGHSLSKTTHYTRLPHRIGDFPWFTIRLHSAHMQGIVYTMPKSPHLLRRATEIAFICYFHVQILPNFGNSSRLHQLVARPTDQQSLATLDSTLSSEQDSNTRPSLLLKTQLFSTDDHIVSSDLS